MEGGKPARRVMSVNISVIGVRKHLDVEIIDTLASEFGIKDEVQKEAFVMMYSQFLDRPSINRIEEWLDSTDILEMLNIKSITTAQLYSVVEEMRNVDFSMVKGTIRKSLSENEKKRSLIIDLTDMYFEGESMDDDPRRGKNGKARNLLKMSLVVTGKHGFPILHKVYGGNISSKRVFTDVLATLERSGYDGVIMDRGFYVRRNVTDLLFLNLKVICGVVKDRSIRPILNRLNGGSIYSKKNM